MVFDFILFDLDGTLTDPKEAYQKCLMIGDRRQDIEGAKACQIASLAKKGHRAFFIYVISRL